MVLLNNLHPSSMHSALWRISWPTFTRPFETMLTRRKFWFAELDRVMRGDDSRDHASSAATAVLEHYRCDRHPSVHDLAVRTLDFVERVAQRGIPEGDARSATSGDKDDFDPEASNFE
jgi:hypothetical protein